MTADQSPLSPPADAATLAALIRIADALERLAPPAVAASDIHAADGFIWDAVQSRLEPVPRINRVPIELLRGVERSEEHTSELQSLMRISYAVLCLKKKTNNNTH